MIVFTLWDIIVFPWFVLSQLTVKEADMIRMGCQVELPCAAEEYFAVCLNDESQFMQMYCDSRKDSELKVICSAFMTQVSFSIILCLRRTDFEIKLVW